MNIEVTKKTFNLLFDNSNFFDNEQEETYNKECYFNKELEQSGIIIHNFVSSVIQYYLIDINKPFFFITYLFPSTHLPLDSIFPPVQ